MKKRFERPLSAAERIWLCYDRAFVPYANQCVLDGSGHIDHDQLENAVAIASEANPGSRLVLEGRLGRARWVDSHVTPRVRSVPAETWDGRGPDNAPFLSDPLPSRGPTCEVVRAEGPVPRLIFRTNHGVMDGMGTLIWVEDIFRVLRGEDPLGSSSTLTEYDVIRNVSDRSVKMHPLNSIAPTGGAGWPVAGMIWKRLTLPGLQQNLMGKIATTLAGSAWRYGDGAFRVAVPVDERFRCAGTRSTGNLAMAIYIEVSRNSTPESIDYEIPRQLFNNNDCVAIKGGDFLEHVPIWLIAKGLAFFTRLQYLTGRYSVSALISSLCQANANDFHGGGFRTETMFFIPPRLEGLPVFVSLARGTDVIEMIVSVPRVLAGNGRFEQLLNDLQETLMG
ncbi:MAG: hypothetical protein JXA07_10195 [Spirochaetes bacterium]|nr:hypothetical protein [Spirochaetota bacterium]